MTGAKAGIHSLTKRRTWHHDQTTGVCIKATINVGQYRNIRDMPSVFTSHVAALRIARQVLKQLISNALDAMQRDGGTLFLRGKDGRSWRTGHRGLVLTVADTGIGMNATTRARLFEAFYTTKGIGGTGLGLWLSREIVERHQGSITVKSNQKQGGSGSLVRVFLPHRETPD